MNKIECLLIITFLILFIKMNASETIHATHLLTLPLYQSENVYVVFAKGEGDIFPPDSTIILQLKPIEDTVNYNLNKKKSLKEYVQTYGLLINADDYCELKYNDKVIMTIDSITGSYMNADHLYIRTNYYKDKKGFWNPLKKFYETKDLILYNRKIYVKESIKNN